MKANVQLEPEAKEFAQATAKPPYLTELGPVKGRETLDKVQSDPIGKPDADVEDLKVPGGPTGEVSVRIVRPKGAADALPVVVYIHGAGWVFGDALTHDRLVRELAVGAQAAIAFVNYSRSPEVKYPTAIEEIYAAVKWAAENGLKHGLDPKRLAVAGDSVGGNMTAAITLMAKERRARPSASNYFSTQ